jgi:hypothetical protein
MAGKAKSKVKKWQKNGGHQAAVIVADIRSP